MLITANNPYIQFVGRSYATQNGLRFAFSGCEIILQLRSSNLSVCLWDEFGNNCFSLWINNQLINHCICTHQGQHEYQIPLSEGNQTQTIRLVKRTEARCGEVELIHFKADTNTQLYTAPVRERKILFIGDSITCGYGIEAADQFCSFVSAEEDVLQTYAGIAATAFNAEAQYICFSGKGIYRNWGDTVPFQNTMTEIAHLVTPQNKDILFHWPSFLPDCAVIALGSNDLGYPEPINTEAFVSAYQQFVLSIQSKLRPHTPIFCVNSPLLPSAALKTIQTCIETLGNEHKDIHYVAQSRQTHHQGFGADWHPSRKQASINGREIITAISSIMPWDTIN